MLRLKINGATSLIPHYTFIAETGITLTLPLNASAMTSFSRRTAPWS
jgi:hypothetical protein